MASKTNDTTPARIQAAKAELQRLDGLLDEISELRQSIATAADSFVSGDLSIAEAAGLLVASSTDERNDLANKLRAPVKRAARAVLDSVQDLVDKRRTEQLVEAQERLNRIEDNERATAAEINLGYHRSPIVNTLAQQVDRLAAIVGSPATREELYAL